MKVNGITKRQNKSEGRHNKGTEPTHRTVETLEEILGTWITTDTKRSEMNLETSQKSDLNPLKTPLPRPTAAAAGTATAPAASSPGAPSLPPMDIAPSIVSNIPELNPPAKLEPTLEFALLTSACICDAFTFSCSI